MANFDAQPVNAGTSIEYTITADVRVAAPFTESNLTWVEVENSTAADWAGFYIINVSNTLAATTPGMLFVAKGAAASEVRIAVIPTNISRTIPAYTQYIPVPVPSGTRLSVAASTEAARTVYGQLVGVLSADFDAEPTYTAFESGPYDLTAGATYGEWTEIDPGATINTKGSYTEISQTSHTNNILNGDSLANTYDYFGFMIGDNFWTSARNQGGLVDLATGATSSEVIFAPDIASRVTSQEFSSNTCPIMTKMTAATSGTRISARMQASTNDVTDRIRGVLLFGVR